MKLSVFYDHIIEAAEQQHTDIASILHEIKGCGIQAIEVNFTRFCEEKETLMELLQKNSMQISGLYEFYDWGKQPDLSLAKKQVDTAAQNGISNILVVPGFVSEDEISQLIQDSASKETLYPYMQHNPKIQSMKHALRSLVSYAADKHVTVTLEDFDNNGAPYATAKQLLWFMQEVPGLRFTMDTGNFAFSDEDAYEAFQTLKPYMVHIHCKDRGIEEHSETHLYNKGLATVPTGSGYMPIAQIVAETQKDGYQGYYVIEHFGAENQLDTIKKSASFLTNLF